MPIHPDIQYWHKWALEMQHTLTNTETKSIHDKSLKQQPITQWCVNVKWNKHMIKLQLQT
jgi:hypothetical protein